MNPVLTAGTRIVILALLSYSAAVFLEQRSRRISSSVLAFQNLGLLLDITATALMIIGSRNTPFTIHGIFGYSALAAMVLETIFMWRFRTQKGAQAGVTKSLHLYAKFAYMWWLLAFIVGGLMVFL